jgi:uncharacterized delta-60 repeat protein
MTARGNEVSWRKTERVRAQSKRMLARAVVEALEERRLLSISMSSLPNLRGDPGTTIPLNVSFSDDTPSESDYTVLVGTETQQPTSYSVSAPDGYGQVDVGISIGSGQSGDQHYYVTVSDGQGDQTNGDAYLHGNYASEAGINLRLGATNATARRGEPFNLRMDWTNTAFPLYSAEVNWGDGSEEQVSSPLSGDIPHIYANAGQYTISASSLNYGAGAGTGLSFDSSFGPTGIAIAGTSARAMASAGDGTFVAVGSSTIARYNDNGTLDSTFSSDGIAPLECPGANGSVEPATGSAVTVLEDGKILVAGDVWDGVAYRFGLARFNYDGTPDTLFGDAHDGWVVTPFGPASGAVVHARANAMAVDPSTGRITLAGFAGPDMAMARYDADGALDTTFGQGGKLSVNLGSSVDIAYGITVHPSGGFVVAGRKGSDLAVVRLDDDGAMDTLFGDGHDGKEIIDLGDHEYAYSAAVDSQGRIVVAGQTTPYDQARFAMVRLTPHGQLDTGFASGGKLVSGFYENPSYLRSVTLTADDKILVAGGGIYGSVSPRCTVVLMRFNDDGTMDGTFGTSGMTAYDLPPRWAGRSVGGHAFGHGESHRRRRGNRRPEQQPIGALGFSSPKHPDRGTRADHQPYFRSIESDQSARGTNLQDSLLRKQRP